MAGSVQLYIEGEAVDHVQLGETVMDPDHPFGFGEPVQIELENDGPTVLRQMTLHVAGEGETHVQLAEEEDHWMLPGQPLVFEDTLRQGERRTFWVKAVYNLRDAEGLKPFRLVIRARSTG